MMESIENIPIEEVDKNLSKRLSSSSVPSTVEDDQSSLSIVDLDNFPDARRSVSLVHVENKSSLGSFLDQYCSSAESEDRKSPSSHGSETPYLTEHYRSSDFDLTNESAQQKSNLIPELKQLEARQQLNEIPFLQRLNTPYETDSDDSNNSEFDFNPDELDIDILINEDNDDLDDTLVKSEDQQNEKSPPEETSHADGTNQPEKEATTLEILKGLGLANSPVKQTTAQLSQLELSNTQGNASRTAAFIDSLYFAPASAMPTPMQAKSRCYDDTSIFDKGSLNLGMDQELGHDVSDGKPSQTSTMKGDPFSDFSCAKPLNFSEMELQNDSAFTSDMFPNEQFISADNAEAIFMKEENEVAKENQFALNENFVAPNEESGLRDFSTYRMSNISAPTDGEDETSKISIGTYMAKRSDKLGMLEGEGNDERPSFGLNVKTPSPTKPCKLVSNENQSVSQNDLSNPQTAGSASNDSFSSALSVDLSGIKIDDTIDQSLMVSLSKALSDMSASMSNEELAQFIISFSNQKMQVQKKCGKTPTENDKVQLARDILASSASGSSMACSHSSSLTALPDDEMDSTLKSDDVTMTSSDKISVILVDRATSTSTLNDVTSGQENSSVNETKTKKRQSKRSSMSTPPSGLTSAPDGTAEADELPPLPGNDTIFSPFSTDDRVLSSTRANFSLTRGSLSRESIEELHRKLRRNIGSSGPDLNSTLPDVVSDQSRMSLSRTLTPSQQEIDVSSKRSTSIFDSSGPPLSQSSPPFTEPCKLSDITLSNVFRNFQPSTGFDEMTTVMESKVDPNQHLAIRSKRMEETEANRDESTCDEMATLMESRDPNQLFGVRSKRMKEKEAIRDESTCDEMATLIESKVDPNQLLGVRSKKLEKKETSRAESTCSSIHSRDELSSCSSTDILPRASSTRTSGSSGSGRSSRSTHATINQSLSSQVSVSSSATSITSLSSASYPPYPTPTGFVPSCSHIPLEPHLYPPIQPSHALIPALPQRSITVVNPTVAGSVYSSSLAGSYTLSHPYQHVSTIVSLPNRATYPETAPYYEDLPSVSTPNDLRFDHTLCVGVPAKIPLPLQNTGPRWVQVEFRCLSVTINQKVAPLNYESYVALKQKQVVGPRSKEDTDITVIGHQTGKYHIVIEIITNLIGLEENRTGNQRCVVSTLSVIADVDVPRISLYGTYEVPDEFDQKRIIDFGEVVLGTNKSLPLRLLNKGKVEVPIQILLFTPTNERSSFSLSLSSSAVGQSSLAVLRTVLTVSDQPTTIWVHFHSSAERSLPDERPVKIEGRIEAILDAPFKSAKSDFNFSQREVLLDTISLACLVGIGKLHAPRAQHMLTFTACRGSSEVKQFPVKNAGNISVQVLFSFENQNGFFTLQPSSVVLPPGDEIELTVKFHPPSTSLLSTAVDERLKNLIYMKILPSGPQFEVPIHGIVTSSYSDAPTTTSPSPPNLLTNKTCLRWGGVPLGKAQKHILLLRSTAKKKRVNFRCSIKEASSSNFQIVSCHGDSEEWVRNCVMSVGPDEELSVSVIFTPLVKKLIRAQLEIKAPAEGLPGTRYTIPLAGYGGVSKIQLENVDRSNTSSDPLHNGYVPGVYSMTCDNSAKFNQIKVVNRGNRSAFVKVVIYSDLSLQHVSPSVLCSPSQFVVGERQFRDVIVRFLTSDPSPVVICFWYGDELSRLLMRRSVSSCSMASSLIARCVPQSHSYIRSISFGGDFSDQDSWKEEDLSTVKPNSYDVQTFYLNLKQALVEVATDSQISTSSSDTVTSSNLSCHDLPVKDVRGDTTMAQQISICRPPVGVPLSNFGLNWSLSPTHLTLTLPPKQDAMGQNSPKPVRVRIKNNSLTSLVFDVSLPIHYVTITPHRGKVAPESSEVLLINANPSLASGQGLLPWCGQAVVCATGGSSDGSDNTKAIHILIKNGAASTSADTSSKSGDMASPSGDVIGEDSLVAGPHTPKLKVLKNPIEFETVPIGTNSKSHLEFRNMSKNAIKWRLGSLAPSYVKSSCAAISEAPVRSNYTVFSCSHLSGTVEPAERVKLQITFFPVNAGLYTQQWDLEYHVASDVAALTLQKEKINLSGKGSSPLNVCSNQSAVRKSDVKNDIGVAESCYWFPDTVVGRSSVIKIPVKNKSKSHRVVKFINLRTPFHIVHQKHSIKPMCCLNFPVTFKSSRSGDFSDILVIRSEGSPDVRVTLKAKAVVR